MSFGFSVGDFVTAAGLIRDIISCLRTASISEYRELIFELHGLQRALYEIEHLQCLPDQEAAVSGIKVAALMCQHPLDEFAKKLKKFESLGTIEGEKMSKADVLKMWRQKLRWGFCMAEEVARLRAYLAAHVGSLNMRLTTHGLTTASIAIERAGKGQTALERCVEESHSTLSNTRKEVEEYGSITRSSYLLLQRISNIVTTDVAGQLMTLVKLAGKVWQSNLQIVALMVKLQSGSSSPELRYTWVQEPVRFEDALGRVIPVPSEYNWGKLEAIILDQFGVGPGHEKVYAGEYELFNALDSTQTFTQSTLEILTPGLNVTMAIVIGQYGQALAERCVRPGCRSKKSLMNDAGVRICSLCKVWFSVASKSITRPLRLFDFQHSKSIKADETCRTTVTGRAGVHSAKAPALRELYTEMQNERRGFKNVRICLTHLPESPAVFNVRRSTPPRRKKLVIRGGKKELFLGHSADPHLKEFGTSSEPLATDLMPVSPNVPDLTKSLNELPATTSMKSHLAPAFFNLTDHEETTNLSKHSSPCTEASEDAEQRQSFHRISQETIRRAPSVVSESFLEANSEAESTRTAPPRLRYRRDFDRDWKRPHREHARRSPAPPSPRLRRPSLLEEEYVIVPKKNFVRNFRQILGHPASNERRRLPLVPEPAHWRLSEQPYSYDSRYVGGSRDQYEPRRVSEFGSERSVRPISKVEALIEAASDHIRHRPGAYEERYEPRRVSEFGSERSVRPISRVEARIEAASDYIRRHTRALEEREREVEREVFRYRELRRISLQETGRAFKSTYWQ